MPYSPSLTLSAPTVHGPRASTTPGRSPAPPPPGSGFLSSLQSSWKGVPWPSRGFVRGEVMADMDVLPQSTSHAQDGGAGLEELFVYEQYICPFTGAVEMHARTLGAELHALLEDYSPTLMSDQGSMSSSSGVTTPENSPPLRLLPELTVVTSSPPIDYDLKSQVVNIDSSCIVDDCGNKATAAEPAQSCVAVERAGAIRRTRARKVYPTAESAQSPVAFERLSAIQKPAVRKTRAEFVPLLKRRVPAGAIKKPAGGGNPFSGSSEVTPDNARAVASTQTVSTIAVSNEVAPAPTRLVRPFGIGEGQNPPGQFKQAVAQLRQATTLGIVFEAEEEDGDDSVTIEPSPKEEVGATEVESHEPEQPPIPIPQSSSRHTRLFTALKESVLGVFKAGTIGSDVESMRSSGSFGCKDRNAHLPSSDSFGCRDRNRHLEDIVIIVTPADDDDTFN